MANIIRNMNFKPIIEKIDYQRLEEPQPSSSVNIRVWDEIKVERLRADAVKVILQNLINKFWLRTDDMFTIENIQKQIDSIKEDIAIIYEKLEGGNA